MATGSLEMQKQRMLDDQLRGRGVSDERVLAAMAAVPREDFVPAHLREFAYDDVALSALAGQTISQPYVVALTAERLSLLPTDRLLEVGAGTGYAASVFAQLCAEVYGIEREPELLAYAQERIDRLGYDRVRLRGGDGTLGWPELAPFDAIVVSAGGPDVPAALREQLAVGGRLIMPVGRERTEQELVSIVREAPDRYREVSLGRVRFVPLVGAAGWAEEHGEDDRSAAADAATTSADAADTARATGTSPTAAPTPPRVQARPMTLPELVASAAEPIPGVQDADLGPFLERVGDRRLVLIGEASHGTSEFYRMRARMTRALIEERGFSFVALEADWPDAARVDRWTRAEAPREAEEAIFSRFPTWMWRNVEVLEFVEWLRSFNEPRAASGKQIGFYGLDLYSLYSSIGEVLRYLERVDPEVARVARERYGCLTPFQFDPAAYGYAALTDAYRVCEDDVAAALRELLHRRGEYAMADGRSFLDAEQNARIAANAERYYRAMYYGSAESWNLRDTHMYETLESLLAFHGRDAKAVVWAHNSHLGDASATAFRARGELNLGQLVRQTFGADAYLVGFGTDHGTVAAASDWDGPVEIKRVRPALRDSYEALCHDAGVPAFMLPLAGDRSALDAEMREQLMDERLERAIGVIYRPETERLSHYFEAVLPRQFDEWIWFDETSAVRPLGPDHAPALDAAHPFAAFDR